MWCIDVVKYRSCIYCVSMYKNIEYTSEIILTHHDISQTYIYYFHDIDTHKEQILRPRAVDTKNANEVGVTSWYCIWKTVL